MNRGGLHSKTIKNLDDDQLSPSQENGAVSLLSFFFCALDIYSPFLAAERETGVSERSRISLRLRRCLRAERRGKGFFGPSKNERRKKRRRRVFPSSVAAVALCDAERGAASSHPRFAKKKKENRLLGKLN